MAVMMIDMAPAVPCVSDTVMVVCCPLVIGKFPNACCNAAVPLIVSVERPLRLALRVGDALMVPPATIPEITSCPLHGDVNVDVVMLRLVVLPL